MKGTKNVNNWTQFSAHTQEYKAVKLQIVKLQLNEKKSKESREIPDSEASARWKEVEGKPWNTR